MEMLERLKRIFQATVGELVEKARDPELELARFVGEVELSLGEVRAEIAEAKLSRDRLALKAAEHRRCADEWMDRAEKAAARDEDELAKEALRHHRSADDEADSSEERLAEAELTLATLRKDEAQLEHKLREVRLEQKRLSASLRRSEAQRRSGAALTRADGEGREAEVVRGRISDTESADDAVREVRAEGIEAQFGQLRAGTTIDDELAALKKRLKKQAK